MRLFPDAVRWLFRLTVLALLLASAPGFFGHARAIAGGGAVSDFVTGRWDLVALNAAFFIAFIALLPYRRMISWRGRGLYSAFILALFAEMYGFPLTAYLLAPYFTGAPAGENVVFEYPVLGVTLGMSRFMVDGTLLTVIGLAFVAAGWRQAYRSSGLVTSGVYALTRHPQYTGILLVTAGWLVHWPTLPTLLLWPLMAATYLRLARVEERDMLGEYWSEYRRYMTGTPMII